LEKILFAEMDQSADVFDLIVAELAGGFEFGQNVDRSDKDFLRSQQLRPWIARLAARDNDYDNDSDGSEGRHDCDSPDQALVAVVARYVVFVCIHESDSFLDSD